ncbi:MAG: Kae1-associated kinase Bud32 [Candidatus Thorarchaeota archaeon]|nr:MAG: Kae1-associated kinase Bud32 [Candidatus Thorarchaeota archaeon]
MEPWAIGAESTIFKTEQWGRPIILKWRPEKPYLLKEIDEQLRRTRTSRECKMLTYARLLGVPTPAVHWTNLASCTIAMDYIEGRQLKLMAGTLSRSLLHELCYRFGQSIALMHRGNVVHGDPTTSNVLIDGKSRLWMVDFGLAEWNATLEMKGVDLHLIHRALETTHWDQQEDMLAGVLEGYMSLLGSDAELAFSRMKSIRERGRYH